MDESGAGATGRFALAAWIALSLSVACWPLGPGAIGPLATAFALLPLLAPLRGMARGRRRTLRWAPLTMAPALTIALTEVVVNEAARIRAAATLALILAAFAAVIAALRRPPPA
jgi:uncharacterized membrane protein